MFSLPKRLSHCILNGEYFEQGMEYFSVLDLDSKRKDYCLHCWEKVSKETDTRFWKGKVPIRKEKKAQPDHQAYEMLKKEKDLKKRYILALYLLRKNQLIQRTQTLYENPETGELFDIPNAIFSPQEGTNLIIEIANCEISTA